MPSRTSRANSDPGRRPARSAPRTEPEVARSSRCGRTVHSVRPRRNVRSACSNVGTLAGVFIVDFEGFASAPAGDRRHGVVHDRMGGRPRVRARRRHHRRAVRGGWLLREWVPEIIAAGVTRSTTGPQVASSPNGTRRTSWSASRTWPATPTWPRASRKPRSGSRRGSGSPRRTDWPWIVAAPLDHQEIADSRTDAAGPADRTGARGPESAGTAGSRRLIHPPADGRTWPKATRSSTR
jgi:hypothetical protein